MRAPILVVCILLSITMVIAGPAAPGATTTTAASTFGQDFFRQCRATPYLVGEPEIDVVTVRNTTDGYQELQIEGNNFRQTGYGTPAVVLAGICNLNCITTSNTLITARVSTGCTRTASRFLSPATYSLFVTVTNPFFGKNDKKKEGPGVGGPGDDKKGIEEFASALCSSIPFEFTVTQGPGFGPKGEKGERGERGEDGKCKDSCRFQEGKVPVLQGAFLGNNDGRRIVQCKSDKKSWGDWDKDAFTKIPLSFISGSGTAVTDYPWMLEKGQAYSVQGQLTFEQTSPSIFDLVTKCKVRINDNPDPQITNYFDVISLFIDKEHLFPYWLASTEETETGLASINSEIETEMYPNGWVEKPDLMDVERKLETVTIDFPYFVATGSSNDDKKKDDKKKDDKNKNRKEFFLEACCFYNTKWSASKKVVAFDAPNSEVALKKWTQLNDTLIVTSNNENDNKKKDY